MADVFLSYSRQDQEFVRRLAQQLEAGGKELWVDLDDIGPAAPWREEIQRGVESCDGFVFVLTPSSLASVECGKELALAVTMSKRIVPVVQRDVDLADVPPELARLNWIMLREGDDFDAGVARLVDALEQDLDWVRAHTRLGERAEEWSAHGRAGAYLLRGSDLADAEALVAGAAGKDPPLAAHQLEYVAAGRNSARRRQRWLLASVTAALVIALVLSVVALRERSTALDASKRALAASHRAEARQLAADAEVQLGTDPELSVLLAEHSYDIDPTAESVATLRHALVSSFITMRVQPPDGVSSAQLTPDGSTLVTLGSTDGVVRRWSYPGGKALGALPGAVADAGQVAVNPVDGRILLADGGSAEVFTGSHLDHKLGTGVTAVAWDPQGKAVVTGTADGRVQVYDAGTGAPGKFAYGLKGAVEQVAESADDDLVAASDGHRVLLADYRVSPVRVPLVRTEGPCPQLLFSPDESRLLAYGGDACSSLLLDTRTGQELPDYSHYGAGAAAFSPDGTALVVGGIYAVSLDPGTGAATYGQYSGHTGPVTGAAFVDHGTGATDFLATAGEDGALRVWQASDPESTVAVLRADETALGALTSSPDGRLLVTVDADQRIARVWADPFPTAAVAVGDTSDSGVGDVLLDAALSPDGGSLLARDDAGLAQYDAGSGRPVRTFADSHAALPQLGALHSIGFLAEGAVVYEATRKGLLAWRTRDGGSLPGYQVPDEGRGLVPLIEVPSTSSDRVLIGLGNGDELGAGIDELDLADPTTGETTRLSDRPVSAAAISADGSVVAFATDRGVEVRSGGRTRLVAAGTASVTRLAFSADGRRLAIADGDRVRVVQVADGTTLVKLDVAGVTVASLDLDAAGDRVAAGGDDGRARVWTVPDGRLLVTATETSTPDAGTAVDTVRLSPDGGFLVTGVGVNDTELWDLSDGVRLYAWPNRYAGWSPGTGRVLTLANAVRVYDCAVCVGGADLRALADRSTTRDLTAAERARYLP